jgi:xylan 1,4-beta-xylosidase
MITRSLARLVLGGLLLLPASSFAQTRSIEVDLNAIQGPLNTTFKTMIGAGRANEGLRADWQQQLAEIKRDADFKYIRMHGLLTDDMGVYASTRRAKSSITFSI